MLTFSVENSLPMNDELLVLLSEEIISWLVKIAFSV